MIKIENNQIYSTDKYLHRKGGEAYFKRCFLLRDETEEDFEEVDKIPNEEIEYAQTN